MISNYTSTMTHFLLISPRYHNQEALRSSVSHTQYSKGHQGPVEMQILTQQVEGSDPVFLTSSQENSVLLG